MYNSSSQHLSRCSRAARSGILGPGSALHSAPPPPDHTEPLRSRWLPKPPTRICFRKKIMVGEIGSIAPNRSPLRCREPETRPRSCSSVTELAPELDLFTPRFFLKFRFHAVNVLETPLICQHRCMESSEGRKLQGLMHFCCDSP